MGPVTAVARVEVLDYDAGDALRARASARTHRRPRPRRRRPLRAGQRVAPERRALLRLPQLRGRRADLHGPVPQIARWPIAIPWHRRLEARVLAGVTAIIGVSLAALTLVTGEVVSSATRSSRAEDDLGRRAGGVHQPRDDALRARRRADAPHHRPPRLPRPHDRLAPRRRRARRWRRWRRCTATSSTASFTIVTDGRGRWLASPGLPANASRDELEALSAPRPQGRAAARDRRAARIALYLVVAEPATVRRRSARHADDRLRARRRDGLRAVADDGARRRARAGAAISGSSLVPAPRQRLADVLRVGPAARSRTGGDVQVTALGQRGVRRAPLPAVGERAGAPELILLESWAPTQAFIEPDPPDAAVDRRRRVRARASPPACSSAAA